MKPTLLIRADASFAIGFGHVLRCLALAQAWQDAGGEAIFACAALPELLQARLEEEQCCVELTNCEIGSTQDAATTIEIARQHGAEWIIADSYAFDFAWQEAIKNAGVKLLVLDDYGHATQYAAGIVLNPNAGASGDFYLARAPHSEILVGARFALLRREFRLSPRTEKSTSTQIERVLIAMGGTDALGLTSRALRFLQHQNFGGEVVVLGGARDDKVLSGNFNVRFIQATRDVPDWMRWCDLALAAAGSTTWELACCGVPAILSVVAPNQRALASWCGENGVALNIGEADDEWESRLENAWSILQNQNERRETSERAQNVIDGQGATRAVAHLWPDALQLRAVTVDDARLLWQWRNEEHTRAMSLQSEFISWESHFAWLESRLSDPNSALCMAHKNGELVGHIRFWREGDGANISVVVSPKSRGRGVGSALIESGCRALLRFWNVSRIRAFVKTENEASKRAFVKAGFRSQTEDLSMPVLEFLLERRA